MPLSLPNSPDEIEKDIKTDFQRELIGSNPFLPNSWTSALISGFANRLFDNFITLNKVVEVSFYDTSPKEYLERQADWYGVTRFDALQSTGKIIATGTNGTLIPAQTEFVSSDGVSCLSDLDSSITNKNHTPLSIESSGTVATCFLGEDHEISENVNVVITGANESEYNGVFSCNVLSDRSFTYILSNATTSPATGAFTVSYQSAIINVTTNDFAENANLDGGSKITLSGSISGIDNDSIVFVNGLTGGSDLEDIEEFRKRFLDRVRNPVANFNVSSIVAKAREISGVTRVFVQEVTPFIGQVTIFFTRDNDLTILPSASETLEVKNKILEIKPANTSDADVFVDPLVGVDVDFTFSSISPNTETMKTAIKNSLEEFFKTIPIPEINLTEDQYRTAIQNTIDIDTGERIKTFSISSPLNSVIVGTGQIAILGNVTI